MIKSFIVSLGEEAFEIKRTNPNTHRNAQWRKSRTRGSRRRRQERGSFHEGTWTRIRASCCPRSERSVQASRASALQTRPPHGSAKVYVRKPYTIQCTGSIAYTLAIWLDWYRPKRSKRHFERDWNGGMVDVVEEKDVDAIKNVIHRDGGHVQSISFHLWHGNFD